MNAVEQCAGRHGARAAGMENRQGKCEACRVRYTWPANLGPLAGARCPSCRGGLKRTVYSAKGLAEVHRPEGVYYERRA